MRRKIMSICGISFGLALYFGLPLVRFIGVFYSLSEQFQRAQTSHMSYNYGQTPPQFVPQTTFHPSQHGPSMPQPFQIHPQPTYQQTFMIPQHRTDRVMYKSTIQPTSNNQNFGGMGLGRLENMGRLIREEETVKRTQNTAVFQAPKPNVLTFRSQRPQRPKMASSVIFFNKNSQQASQHFSKANYQSRDQNQPFSNGFESLMAKARTVKEEEISDPLSQRNHVDNGRIQNLQGQSNRQQNQLKVQGQKVWRSQIMTSDTSFQPQFQVKDFKQFQFSRNPSTKANFPKESMASGQNQPMNSQPQDIKENNGILNKEIQLHQEKKSQKEQKINLINPVQTIQSNIESTGMFKKKSPYVAGQSGKTDQNLLKMLGINLKKSPPKGESQNTAVQTLISKPQTLSIPPSPSAFLKKEEPRPISSKSCPKEFTKSDFKIGKKMGKGQFGQVMLVQHKETGFICGMKVMNKREIRLQKYENQIARELSIQFFLNHRNIAPLYGFFQDEQNVYLLVEFCTDGQLLEMLRKSRRMQEADVSPIMCEICEGLDYIHKQEIIHRDVKPENILFNFGTVKISDFGWAVHSGSGMRRTISGSPLYYSPEIVMETQYNQKIDLWSIGMMTYECLLGKIPFRIYSELDLNRIVQDDINFPQYVDVSDDAKDFILKIMKKKPEQRMEMRQILRHPFITKYSREKKVASSILEELKAVLKL